MSDLVKLSSKNVKRWLEDETGSVFVPVHAKAQKLVGEMSKELDGLRDSCKMLLDNSGKEIEKRNEKTFKRARALNKLARLFLERVQHVKIPEVVSYNSFHELVQEMQKVLLVIEVDIRNWFPRISPFFILDRRRFLTVFERNKETAKELNSFLTKEYVKTKTLEETLQLADKLLTLEQQSAACQEQKGKAEGGKRSIEGEITETQQEVTALRSKGGLSQLTQINAEIDALCMELKHDLQHLQKPFVKLQSLALHGGGSGLVQDESAKLNQYLEDLFEAFAAEATGYPVLKAILEKLESSMPDKLNLKPEKERKARQAIDSIFKQNSLASLHQKCAEASTRKKQLSASAEVTAIQADLSKLQERIETLERKKKVAESEATVAERAYNEAMEKIRNTKSGIEKNVSGFMGKKIHVE